MIDLPAIRDGFERGEFFLEYLPTVSLIDGHCMGAEALIRWRRGTGVIPPNDFIPLADNTHMSGVITYWVVDALSAELGDWLNANPNAHLAFNAPPEILGRGGLGYVVAKSGLGKSASQLFVEITERGVPDLLGVSSINARVESDPKYVLDDVTLVGGANLAILTRSNFDAIKLDKSLIDQLQPERSVPSWLRTIGALIESSQLLVIAEGVETEHQAMMLRSAHIQAAQGYYFSPPVGAGAFMAFHRDHNTQSGVTH